MRSSPLLKAGGSPRLGEVGQYSVGERRKRHEAKDPGPGLSALWIRIAPALSRGHVWKALPAGVCLPTRLLTRQVVAGKEAPEVRGSRGKDRDAFSSLSCGQTPQWERVRAGLPSAPRGHGWLPPPRPPPRLWCPWPGSLSAPGDLGILCRLFFSSNTLTRFHRTSENLFRLTELEPGHELKSEGVCLFNKENSRIVFWHMNRVALKISVSSALSSQKPY